MSPLGGQASLRVLDQKNIAVQSKQTDWQVLDTFSSGPWPELNGDPSASSLDLQVACLQALSLSSNDYIDTSEPLIDKMGAPAIALTSTTSWNCSTLTLYDGREIVVCPPSNYSSFVGIPISEPYVFHTLELGYAQFRAEANLSFLVSLFDFNCKSVTQHPPETWLEFLPQDSLGQRELEAISLESSSRAGFFLAVDKGELSINGDPRSIVFGSFGFALVTRWQCSVTHNSGDIHVQCVDPFSQGFPLGPQGCTISSVGVPIPSRINIWEMYSDIISYVWRLVDLPPLYTSTRTEIFLRLVLYPMLARGLSIFLSLTLQPSQLDLRPLLIPFGWLHS